MTHLHRTLLVVFTLALTFGCKVGPFGDLEDEAPIRSLKATQGYPVSAFSTVVASYVGETPGLGPISRIVAGAGPRSPFLVYEIWNDEEIGQLKSRFDGCDDIVDEDNPDCPPGTGADMIGLPSWEGRHDCVMASVVDVSSIGSTPSEDEGGMRIQCEQDGSITRTVNPVPTVDAGVALAPLAEGHSAGVALIGAPGDMSGGQIYRLEDGSAAPIRVTRPVGLDSLAVDAQFGAALETFPMSGAQFGLLDPVLVLASAKGANRVVVMAIGTNMEVTPTVEMVLLGCFDDITIRSPAEAASAGGTMTAGDINGDGIPEIFMGDPEANIVRQATLDGMLMGGTGCASGARSDDPPTTDIACPDQEGITCGSFGAGLAVGDINVDGLGDLLVGAPQTRDGVVDTDRVTGALYVIPAGTTGLDLGSARGVIPSGITGGARLGETVVVSRTQLGAMERDEPVASAPGDEVLYFFFCTGISGDEAMGDDRCLR